MWACIAATSNLCTTSVTNLTPVDLLQSTDTAGLLYTVQHSSTAGVGTSRCWDTG